MKATIIYSALLAVIIQVMVKDQTHENPVVSNNPVKKEIQTAQLSKGDPESKKLKPILHKRNPVQQGKVTKANITSTSHSYETYYLESNGKIRKANENFSFAQLQNQANDLYNKSAKLRYAAYHSQGLVKSELLFEANDLQRLYLIKKIEASEALSRTALIKFSQSKERIDFLLNQFKGSTNVYKNASTLSDEAGQIMKMAREIREEAHAMPTLQGEYGAMTNAEEKENLALNMQNETIDLLVPTHIQFNTNNKCVSYEGTPYFPKVKTLSDLLQDVDDLNSKSHKLKMASISRTGLTKTELISEANYLYRLSGLKQIEASEMSAKMCYQKFSQTKTVFNSLLNNYKGDKTICVAAKNLINDAERCIKLAKEMREEAYAMPTLEAKLGTMTNAEEKETLALNKEDKAVDMIKKAPKVNYATTNDIVANLLQHSK